MSKIIRKNHRDNSTSLKPLEAGHQVGWVLCILQLWYSIRHLREPSLFSCLIINYKRTALLQKGFKFRNLATLAEFRQTQDVFTLYTCLTFTWIWQVFGFAFSGNNKQYQFTVFSNLIPIVCWIRLDILRIWCTVPQYALVVCALLMCYLRRNQIVWWSPTARHHGTAHICTRKMLWHLYFTQAL